MTGALFEIKDLTVAFETDEGRLTATEGVGLSVFPNEVLGLVGESGCGKSVTALGALSLVPRPPAEIVSGEVLFDGRDLLRISSRELAKVRGREISMIFQEPMTALSPLHRVGAQLAETLRIHKKVSRKEAREAALSWLAKTGIPSPRRMLSAYPHELSGGMRQRIMIAMALMLSPSLVIADEPTTALDVTISAQIFELLNDMTQDKTSVLLITHDLGVVWEMCDRVAVMYAGQVVEEAPKKELFENPAHPYTRGLMQSVPALSLTQKDLHAIPGQVPSPLAFPSGCRFHDRCGQAFGPCRYQRPQPSDVGPDHWAACFLFADEDPDGARATTR